MRKKYKKIIALVGLTAAFIFVAVGLNHNVSDAADYYGGNYLLSSSYYVSAGGQVTIHGYRFYPNEWVTITGGSKNHRVQADSSGHFSKTFTIGYKSPSQRTKTVSATGDISKSTRSLGVVVAGFYPNISPSTYFLYPGESISWSGSGFAGNETVNAYRNGQLVATTQSSGDGSFGGVRVTENHVGNQTYQFVGATSGASVSRTIIVGDPWWD